MELFNKRDEFWKSATVVDVEKYIEKYDVNARDGNGMTALMEASILNKNPKVIEVLIKDGADVNVRLKDDGRTALMLAIMNNKNSEIIEVLLKHGADVKARDEDGSTALDYMKENEALKGTEIYWKLNDLSY